MSKKAVIYLNNDASALLKIIGNRSHGEPLSLTGSLHFLVDSLIDSMPRLPLTASELLFCCEHVAAKGGDAQTETLDDAFERLCAGLEHSLDEIHLEKYRADASLIDRIKSFSNIEKLTLLFLVRWYRLTDDVRLKELKNLFQSSSSESWAMQFIKSGD